MSQSSHFLIADWISLFGVLYFIAPFGIFFITQDTQHLIWSLSVACVPFLSEIIKKLTRHMNDCNWCTRPDGALNCDTWNTNGPQAGTPGFPSGHTATAAAFWMGVYILTPAEYKLWILIVGIVGIVGMAWSRLNKQCHTLLQTIGGGILGAGTSYILLRHR